MAQHAFQWYWLGEFLNRIEEKEAELLQWGIVDGSHSEDELEELAEAFVKEHQVAWQNEAPSSLWSEWTNEPYNLVYALQEKALLHRFTYRGDDYFRTRMAEGIRLFSNLRQLFPKHSNNKEYASALPLVADFRLLLRPREYPNRKNDWNSVYAMLDQKQLLGSSTRTHLLKDMIVPKGSDSYKLADFQVRSTERILRCSEKPVFSSGSIVCAGTGSGKTLAFYLPALTLIGERLSAKPWVQCLAMYPRNELLKDQLNETYQQARKLDATLLQSKGRKLRIGALYGSVPKQASTIIHYKTWAQKGDGYVCPFLQCPECGGELLWSTQDIRNNHEHLRCASSRCSGAITGDEVILTRDRMQREPPDILFTTTEMLNQRMSDHTMNHLFGLGQPKQNRPYLLLLDEVHTYFGLHGAQVSNLLRRWQRMLDISIHFVGLSATLRDATQFFATLTGLPEDRVSEIAPEDLVREGREYMLALRNDPGSRTSLLSTTIQASMLMRRIMNPITSNQEESIPFTGNKLFLFTDDLNVTNRLFFALRDAEGWTSGGRPKSYQGSLASFRDPSTSPGNLPGSYKDGQQWKLPKEIGFSLSRDERSRVSRTSSQDTGVDTQAEQIVATASLEVGYNDKSVGAVIQHKSPIDMAQFLQRKGRAGRPRGMRPWTIVVMSDYGRDRATYQNYDRLFSPELTPRHLPVNNRYILRMQAVLSLLDWISMQVGQARSSHINGWRLASGDNWQGERFGSKVVALLRDLLHKESTRNDLETWLLDKLQLQNKEHVQALLWSPPRSLLLHVVPTLLRRLESRWTHYNEQLEAGEELKRRNHPLPEFLPPNLFSDLNLPEVMIELPPNRFGDQDPEMMGVPNSLREFAPGRVTKRFAFTSGEEMHWSLPSAYHPDTHGTIIDCEELCEQHYDDLGESTVVIDGETQTFRLLRPHKLKAKQVGDAWRDSCNATAKWATEARLDAPPISLLPYLSHDLRHHVERLDIYAHIHNNPMELRRLSYASDATLYPENKAGETQNLTFRFAHNEQAAALGFSMKVDGLRFVIRIPNQLEERLATDSALRRSMLLRLFEEHLLHGAYLDGFANTFQRQWLFWGFVGLITGRAIQHEESLQEAHQFLLHQKRETFPAFMARCLRALFRVEIGDPDSKANTTEENLKDLEKLCLHPHLTEVLDQLAPLLYEPPRETLQAWLERCYLGTYAAAVMVGLQRMCPDLNLDSLLLDLTVSHTLDDLASPNQQLAEFWITETSPGGVGIIEAISEHIQSDRRLLGWHIEYSLRKNGLEVTDQSLETVLQALSEDGDPSFKRSVQAYRKSLFLGHHRTQDSWEHLRNELTRLGLPELHTFYSGLQIRLLRAGSTSELDALLSTLMQSWNEHEANLGIEIDTRIFSYLSARSSDLNDSLRFMDNRQSLTIEEGYNILYSLLWSRGGELRLQGLEQYSPYMRYSYVDRLLLQRDFQFSIPEVQTSSENWQSKLHKTLIQYRDVHLVDDANILTANELVCHIVQPIDEGDILSWPSLAGVPNTNPHTTWHLSLTR